MVFFAIVHIFRGVYRKEVDATCVQLRPVWLKGKEFHPQGGRIPPDIWVIFNTLMIVL